MEIILLADVDRLGHEGEVVRVADGYAHNFLLPKRLAEPCTKGALKDLEQRRRAIQRREEEKRGKAQGLVAQMEGQGVVVKAHVGEGGRLHGQVTTQQIAEAITQQLGHPVDRRRVEISTPIREVGVFPVKVTLYKDVVVQLPVHVISVVEDGATPAFEAQAAEPEAPEAAEAGVAEAEPAEASEAETEE